MKAKEILKWVETQNRPMYALNTISLTERDIKDGDFLQYVFQGETKTPFADVDILPGFYVYIACDKINDDKYIINDEVCDFFIERENDFLYFYLITDVK